MRDEDIKKQEAMRKYYNKSDYYERTRNNFADKKNRFNKYMVKNAFSIYYPKKEEKIIDLGCGWGNISLALQSENFDVTGLDYSLKSVEICKKTALKMGFDPNKFICADATNTGLKKNSFDVAYCCDLVEHLYPEIHNKLISEARRILKKGGKFVIYTPNPTHIFELLKQNNIILKKDVAHVDYKTMARLIESLKNNGFIIKKSFYIESHVPLLRNFEKVFLSYIPILRRRIAVLAEKADDN